MHEWTLLLFTFIMQTAIGGTVFLWVYQNRMKNELSKKETFQLFRLPLLLLSGLSLIGLVISMLHLGKVLHAPFAIFNIGSSWLSREILVTSLFILGITVVTFLAFKKKEVNSSLLLTTSIIGLIDVGVMAAIYANTIVDAWNHINTYIAFYFTTFSAGIIFTVALLYIAHVKTSITNSTKLLPTAFILAIIAFGIQLAVLPGYMISLYEAGTTLGMSTEAIIESYKVPTFLRWGLTFVGLLLFGFATFAKKPIQQPLFLYTAVACILVAEFVGRYIFYAMAA